MLRRAPTVIIGAGQAGLALSHALARAHHDHVVLERGRLGERWRSERWPSLTLLTPNWLNALPGAPAIEDPHGYLGRDALVAHLEAYARSFGAPVAEGVTVLGVARDGSGFRVDTEGDTWAARNVVLATGDCDLPRLPPIAQDVPDAVASLHTSRYRSPGDLPPGGVLVVGAGPTGQQLALELRRAGRDVTLAVGGHSRMVRRYRGRDIFAWQVAVGQLDATIEDVPNLAAARRAPSFALTGSNGGEALDLGRLHDLGVGVTGRLTGFSGRHALFADDLRASLSKADARMRRTLETIDAHIAATGIDAPPAEEIPAVDLPASRRTLDLRGVGTVLWATGYRRAYPWLHVPVLDRDGEVIQRRGVTPVHGLYTLGLRFQRKRKSHFLGGVGEDAALIARHILHAEPRRHRVPRHLHRHGSRARVA